MLNKLHNSLYSFIVSMIINSSVTTKPFKNVKYYLKKTLI